MIGMIQVVIVEDDYRIGNIHEEFVNKVDGFQVVGKALNGKEALKLVEEYDVDLLLLDIYMPDVLGTNLMTEIRKINLKIDVIIISAATEKDIIEDAIRLGAFDYIIKPVKMKRFIDTLERYKKMRKRLEDKQTVDQDLLDRFFGHTESDDMEEDVVVTPKGIDPLTLKKVEDVINQTSEGITAEEMGNLVGASRTTARRYLEYLISEGRLVAELEYGAVGRPERKYFAAGDRVE
jgi:CitB family two-component system response regulator CitT